MKRSRIVIPRELTISATVWPPVEWDLAAFSGDIWCDDITHDLFVRNEFAIIIDGDEEAEVRSLTTNVMTWLLGRQRAALTGVR